MAVTTIPDFMERMRMESVDVLLLCAVKVEWDGLQDLVVDPCDEPVLSDPAIRGRLELNNRTFSAALVEVGKGQTRSAIATQAAILKFQPKLVVFIGIAGGIKDVKIGDVVIAEKAYNYENGKVKNGKFEARPEVHSVPARLLAYSRKFQRNFLPIEYEIHVGAIASGDKVLEDLKAEELERIRSHYGDSLAVEMEGAAFFSAIDKSNAEADYFLVRGISDAVDNKSQTDAEGRQVVAVRNAREIAMRLITLWDETSKISIPTEQAGHDLKAAGLPVPSPTTCYVLIAAPKSPYAEAVVKSRLPISMIVDLDTHSRVDGLYACTGKLAEDSRSLHLGEPAFPPNFGIKSTAWVQVQGYNEPATSANQWTRTTRRSWRSLLSKFASAIGERHVVILVTDENDADWDSWRSPIVDDLLTQFGNQAQVGVLGPGRSVESEFRIALPPAALITALSAITPPELTPEMRTLPGPEEERGPVILTARDAAWINEDATVYWIAAPDTSEAESDAIDFLMGGEISVRALEIGADVTRSQESDIQKQLIGMLSNRSSLRLNLFHAPGAGGTTLARRIGFNIRSRFPVLLLHRIRPGETVRRIAAVSRQTEKPVLVIAEAADVRNDQIATLHDELSAESISAVVLAVSRAYSKPTNNSSLYLPEVLDDWESDAFVNAYSARSFTARGNLTEVSLYQDERRNAFFFGLAAFEENFQGIGPFVRGRLAGIEGEQRTVMLICSIAHFFGQSSIPEYALASLMGLPSSRSGGFARAIAPELRGLLWRSSEGEWRTTHRLVSQEILRQLGGEADQWKLSLAKWGRLFAEFCQKFGEDHVMQGLLEDVFVERDDDFLQPGVTGASTAREKFARLIEAIPTKESAARLLKEVAELQSDHPHIWAHAARYYAFRMQDYEAAEGYARMATKISPDNSTLHHILAMVHRARVYDGLGRRVEFEELTPWVENASTAFAKSRELATNKFEHGFVSEIQMHVRIVEYAIGKKTVAEYLKSTPHRLVVSSLEKAEDLIYTLRYRGNPQAPSGFLQSERAKLKRVYGNYNDSLQLLNTLLERGTVPLPVVRRQLVWTYLARVDGDWRSLQQKDVKRIVSLLDENLENDGYSASDALAWWRAIRLMDPPLSHERVIEALAFWRALNPSVGAEYCSYVAYALDVLDGRSQYVREVAKHVQKSTELSRSDGDRKRAWEWYGKGQGLASLVHHSELGHWDTRKDFWEDTKRLRKIEARITQIQSPQTGSADVMGMKAFFTPYRAGAERGRDENKNISGYLAFTHAGLRIWEPTLTDPA